MEEVMVTRNWIGGGENAEASDPANWSPTGAPRPGDTLTMLGTSPDTIDVAKNRDLAGDALNVRISGTPAIFGGSAVIDSEPGVTVPLNAIIDEGFLYTNGGTLRFIGTNTFSNGQSILNSNLTGTATLDLTAGADWGQHMIIDGQVGRGLSFKFEPGAKADEMLHVNKPNEFKGLIDLSAVTSADFIGLAHILFLGLEATSATLRHGILTLKNGNDVVDTVRIKDGTYLHVWQADAGVLLTAGNNSDVDRPGHLLGPIPLSH
jgi:hypothetical protein